MEAKKNRIGSIQQKARGQQSDQENEGQPEPRYLLNGEEKHKPVGEEQNDKSWALKSLKMIGLDQCFDPNPGTLFNPSAICPLQRCLIKSVVKQRGVIGLPWHKLSPLYRIESTSGILKGKNDSPVCLRKEENGDGMVELNASRTPHARGIHDTSPEAFISWDKPDHSEPLCEKKPSSYPVPGLPPNRVHMRIHAALENLPGREQIVLKLHYGLNVGEPLTFAKIGRIMKLSLHQVIHLENQAIEHLRILLETVPEKTIQADRPIGELTGDQSCCRQS